MEQYQITRCLSLNSKVALIYSIIVFALLFQKSSIGQELPKNLLYANENLKFEKIYKVGEYKVLHTSPYKQNQRFMYLLDEENVVVDTM
jgi:hypothetical protein